MDTILVPGGTGRLGHLVVSRLHEAGMDELLRAYLRARRTSRPIMPIWFPGKAARAIREGAIVAPDQAVGKRTWEEFLADQLSSSGAAGLAA